ncbi:MAG: RraA family protein [Gammaproteobacteria bacterium]|nr:RraA family protein [Gammaproteobacteria bacterium]
MQLNQVTKRLMKLDTASLADANKALRIMDPAIRPIQCGLKLIGVAHTIRCHEDFLTVIKALRDATPGEVLVIDTGGSRTAVAGELFSTEAKRKGLSGLVIDGACRDTAKLKTLDLPVYSRSVTSVAGTTSAIAETQIAIECGGIKVNPGDVVFGDDDGIIVASCDELARLISVAEDIQRKEEAILRRMDQGESLLDMINFEQHWENVRDGKHSKLEFKT